ncbi:hypothetical protein JAAARDRAFT_183506 [Jaapia argillacea MUCL 33604]|uniref:Uncharacterized protein n=1 Tax=Jaapia argillacea MUCL 33604 TaxID=933084 RepID=A0A067PE42_9AGAM|nr:hypothetical protein JAAARDRAFT_183506 [Jaapia argillacea MUCL 33604]
MQVDSHQPDPATSTEPPQVASADDEAWEDVEYSRSDVQQEGSRPSSPVGSVPSTTTTRRRKPGYKTVYIAAQASPRKPYLPAPRLQSPAPKPPAPKPPPQKRVVKPAVSQEEVQEAISAGAVYTLRYALDVVKRSLWLLRFPLSVLLVIYVLGFIAGQLSRSIQTVFSPLCILPGISSSALCSYPSEPIQGSREPKWADYTKLVDVQSGAFEHLLDETAGGSGLALEVKKAQMATRDLVALVKISDLTSKDLLAETLTGFVEDAGKTGKGLQRLSAKIGGAVDSVLAVNDYALHQIEATAYKSSSSLSLSSLWPFGPSKNEIVVKTFTDAMDVLSTQMSRIILEAEASVQDLNSLEISLNTLYEILAREDSALSKAHEQLLAHLWTKLGGNKRMLKSYKNHLKLLKGLGEYRRRALAHVVAALQTLEGMSADMEELRERVAAPALIGDKVPVEVHMRSIRTGLERLRDMRTKAKEREEQARQNALNAD